MGRASVSLVILSVLFLTTVAPLAAAQNSPLRAAVFMYHEFGEDQFPRTNIRIEQFKEQLQFLVDNEFTVLPLEEIVEALISNTTLPDKAVAITIDDAYRSVYEVAYPLLQQYAFPFTVFIAPKTVDEGVNAYMSWRQVREMHDNGVTFANHSLNHDYLVRKKKGELDRIINKMNLN